MKNRKAKITVFLMMFMMICTTVSSQSQKGAVKNPWKTISKDETVTISYNTNITTKKNGEHIVWVKAV